MLFINLLYIDQSDWPVTKILERGQKWNGVPIFPCKIWHGQENNGMTIKMSNCGIAASSQDIRTMIEAVHVLDRQAGGIQMGVVRQENGRTQSSMSDMKFVKKRTNEWVS